MAKQTLERMVYPKKEEKIYSPFELGEFDTYLQQNKNKECVLQNGEKLVLYDWDKIYKELKVKNPKGDVYVNNVEYGKNKFGEIHIVKCDIPLLELENKIEQWKEWKGRLEYGEKKRLEQLDTSEIVEKFKVHY